VFSVNCTASFGISQGWPALDINFYNLFKKFIALLVPNTKRTA